MARPGIRELLIQSALDADLLERLREDPDAALAAFDLAPEDRELVRCPDHRLLALLGRVLRETQPAEPAGAQAQGDVPQALIPDTLPPVLLALTVAPCLAPDHSLRYAVWVNPMSEGGTPAVLPPPPGAALPGEPLAPLYAVIELDGVRSAGPEGEPQVTLFAQFRQSSNTPPSGERDAASPAVAAAAARVLAATPADRREHLAGLVRALQGAAS